MTVPNTNKFTFNPRPFADRNIFEDINFDQSFPDLRERGPHTFGNFTPTPPDISGLSFTGNTPNTASIDTSNLSFTDDNNSNFFGNTSTGNSNGSFFGDTSIGTDLGSRTSNGFTGLDIARLGIGALNAGGGIFDAFNRRKNLKLARDAFNFQKEAFNKNFGLSKASFDNQVTTVNNRINDQNAFKTAQGRTDLAKLVV